MFQEDHLEYLNVDEQKECSKLQPCQNLRIPRFKKIGLEGTSSFELTNESHQPQRSFLDSYI